MFLQFTVIASSAQGWWGDSECSCGKTNCSHPSTHCQKIQNQNPDVNTTRNSPDCLHSTRRQPLCQEIFDHSRHMMFVGSGCHTHWIQNKSHNNSNWMLQNFLLLKKIGFQPAARVTTQSKCTHILLTDKVNCQLLRIG